MSRGTLGKVGILCAVLMACAPPPRLSPPEASNWAHQARVSYQAGKYRQAAETYRKAAQASSLSQRSAYLLRSADAWIKAGETETAARILGNIDPQSLPLPEGTFFHLLQARVALDTGRPEVAWNHLQPLRPDQIPPPLRKRYLELKARTLTLRGKLAASVRERVQLGALLQTPQEVEDNNRAILEALMLLPDPALDGFPSPLDRDLAGWIELAKILRSHPYRSEDLDLSLSDWQNRYPYHPANRGHFLETVLPAPQPTFPPPRQIALLLPASGPYQTAAQAIQLGIEAVRALPSTPYRPLLDTYDTTSMDAASLYRQASQQGAGFILGPLRKSSLEQLSQLATIDPPVLAFNQIEGVSRPGLFQLALAPEEAVEQSLASAWLHDHRKMLALLPDSPLGKRIEQPLRKYWQALGGEVLEIQYYDPGATDFSAPIRRLLNIDESQRRFQRLRKVVWEIQFEPRIRKDADFLFLQANPGQGRLIRPQLLFHRAEHLSVYATRDIYEGHPNPQWDKDLEGIRFCDIPWLLNGDYTSAPSVGSFEADYGPHSGAYLRLAALGMDAYHLPFTLLSGDSESFSGTTGVLRIAADGRIKRQLTCARFQQGTPLIYGLAPEIPLPPIQADEASP